MFGTAPAIQRVTHEIYRPAHVRLRAHIQWLDHSSRNPLLRSAWPIEPELAIHAPYSFVVPLMAGVP